MSKRNWAIDAEDSSEDGSVEDNEEEEDVQEKEFVSGDSNVEKRTTEFAEPVRESPPPHLVCYLANIAHAVDRKTVGFYFESHQCAIDRLDLRAGDHRGAIAYIAFKDHASLGNALKLNGTTFEGRKLVVKRVGIARDQPQHHSTSGHHGQGKQFPGQRDNNRKGDDRKPPRVQRGPAQDSEHRGGGRGTLIGDRPANVGGAPPQAVPSRPKLQLKERTLPVDAIGQAVVANAAIFGGGKPNDVLHFEVKKKTSAGGEDEAEIGVETEPPTATTTTLSGGDGTPQTTIFEKVATQAGSPKSVKSDSNKRPHAAKQETDTSASSGVGTGLKASSYYNKQSSGSSHQKGSGAAKSGRRAAGPPATADGSRSSKPARNEHKAASTKSGGGREGEALKLNEGRVVVEVTAAGEQEAPGGGLFVATAQRANLVAGRSGGVVSGKSSHPTRTDRRPTPTSEKKPVRDRRGRSAGGANSGSQGGSDAGRVAKEDQLTDAEKFERAQKAHQGVPSGGGATAGMKPGRGPRNAFSALEGSDSD